jgi:hypothetical protein
VALFQDDSLLIVPYSFVDLPELVPDKFLMEEVDSMACFPLSQGRLRRLDNINSRDTSIAYGKTMLPQPCKSSILVVVQSLKYSEYEVE